MKSVFKIWFHSFYIAQFLVISYTLHKNPDLILYNKSIEDIINGTGINESRKGRRVRFPIYWGVFLRFLFSFIPSLCQSLEGVYLLLLFVTLIVMLLFSFLGFFLCLEQLRTIYRHFPIYMQQRNKLIWSINKKDKLIPMFL